MRESLESRVLSLKSKVQNRGAGRECARRELTPAFMADRVMGMGTLTLEFPPQEAHRAFNMRRWAELLADRELARIEGRAVLRCRRPGGLAVRARGWEDDISCFPRVRADARLEGVSAVSGPHPVGLSRGKIGSESSVGNPVRCLPIGLTSASQSGRGQPHSKTLRVFGHLGVRGSVLECGCPLPLFRVLVNRDGSSQTPH